jgi:Arc/MetJ-type ribon-helix-helix transcriptional regulator
MQGSGRYEHREEYIRFTLAAAKQKEKSQIFEEAKKKFF